MTVLPVGRKTPWAFLYLLKWDHKKNLNSSFVDFLALLRYINKLADAALKHELCPPCASLHVRIFLLAVHAVINNVPDVFICHPSAFIFTREVLQVKNTFRVIIRNRENVTSRNKPLQK